MRCLSPHPRMSNVMCLFPRRIYFLHYARMEIMRRSFCSLQLQGAIGKKEGGIRMTEVSDLFLIKVGRRGSGIKQE